MTAETKLAEALGRGDWPAAERILRLLAKAPDAPDAVLYNLAKVLFEQGETRQAIHWFDRILARAPGHQAAWFELGRACVSANDLPRAAEAFGQAARLDPSDHDAWRNLGRVALRLGDWPQAAAAWGQLDDAEAIASLYRARAEQGEASMAAAVDLTQAVSGPEALKALTRTGRGHLPFRLSS